MSSGLSRCVAISGLAVALSACGAGAGARAGTSTESAPLSLPSAAPRNGLEVIGWMRRSHPSRDLKSLSFTLSTTEFHHDTEVVTRARAIFALPGRMRVVELPASRKTGYVRDRDRFAAFARGKRVTRVTRVDVAQLLAYDLFAQSTDTTIMWLDNSRMRFGLARRVELKDRRAWLVGAEDSASTRFWVDAENWRVLRVLQPDPTAPTAPTEMIDVWYTQFTEVNDVPVPVRIEVYRNGRLDQRVEITDIEANPSVPQRAFDLTRWRDVGI